MCELTTILMIGSTLIGGYAQIQAGNAQAAQYAAQAQASQYNAQVAEMNATLADRAAKDAIERGATEEQRKRMEVAQLQGRQRAAMAANGVDLTFGSPLDTLVDTAVMGELDALTIRRNAAREAYDFDVQGMNYRADATLSRMGATSALAGASAAKTGGYLSAAGTVLGGGAKAYQTYRSSLIA
jgi:hypothetical protein